MGRLYKSKKSEDSWSYKTGTDELNAEILKLIEESGTKEVPDTEPKPSVLNRVFGVLSAGETAPLVHELIRTGSLNKALKKQGEASGKRVTGQGLGDYKTYSDVLQQLGLQDNAGTKVAGLGLDILLDPTTYIGAGLLGKIGKGAKKVGSTAGKVISKVPAGAKIVDKTADIAHGVSKLFSPTARLASEGLPTSQADEAYDIISGAFKKGRYQEDLLRESTEKMVKTAVQEGGEDAGTQLARLLESGDTSNEIAETIGKEFKKMWGEEFEKGLIKAKIDDYVPHLMTEDARKFFETSGEGMSKVTPKLQFAKGRKLEGTIPEINKTFRKELAGAGVEPFDLFEEDLFKIFATRGKASIKALTMRGMIDDLVGRFGVDPKSLKVVGDRVAMKDGIKYVPVPEDSIRFFPAELKGGNEILAVAKNNRKYIPKSIADELVNMNKVLINDDSTRSFLKLYDNVLSKWKGSVTSYFPAFHGRNMMGGMFNNYIAGVKNPARYIQADKIAKGSDEVIKLGGKEWTYKQLKNLMLERGVVGSQGYIDIFSEVDKAIKTVPEAGAKKIARQIGQQGPEKLMNAIETRLRGALLIDRLSKGDEVGDAVKQVFKYHFDYAPEAFTPFERNVMRRLIPFYCVPDYSEILTKDGWKTLDDLEVGELSLTYNMDENVMEWKPIKDIAVFEHDQNIRVWESKRHKLVFTHGHRWVAEKKERKAVRPYGIYRYPASRELIPSTELNKSHYLRMLSRYKSDESSLDVNSAKLLGWLLTDGYSRFKGNHCEAVIYQSPRKFLEEVIEVAGGSPRKPHPDSGVVCVPVLKERVEKIKHILDRDKKKDDWVDVVTSLDEESLNAMYNSMMKADGHFGRKQTSFACQLEGVARTFEVLATLLGKRVVRNDRGFYVSDRQTLGIKDGVFKEEHYRGKVWCPKTDNETWVMKQGSLITITGNTWTRNNIPLQIMQMYKQPGKYAGIGKTLRTLEGDEEETGLLPEYMRKSFPIKVGDAEDGVANFLYGMGLPVEDLNKLTSQQALSSLSPLIKAPLELATDRHFYFDRPLSEVNNPPAGFEKVAPKPVKDLVGYNETTGKVDPQRWHILTSLLGRGIFTVDKLADPDTKNSIKLLYLLLGIKGGDVNLEQQKYYRTKEQRDLVGEFLKNKGEAAKFERYYVPK